jgi:aminomethyltransferase
VKATVFNKIHKEAGARMVEFAGYEMPIEYTGIMDEHLAVRNSVGVFDVSHMGEIWVKGPEAKNLLQKITSNDIAMLKPGKAQYSCFPNGIGGIVDDLIVYKQKEDEFLLVVNAANTGKDWQWINKNNYCNAKLENVSDRISQLAVQGPQALNVLQKLTVTDLAGIPGFAFVTTEIAGTDNVIVSNTGYTGAGGFELYFDNEKGIPLWNAIFDAGKEYGIKPVGLAARDTLRLEMCYCLYGNDINDTTSPIEAGLGWITKFTDYKDFIDKERLLRQKTKGVERKLSAFEMIDRGIPRHDYEITDSNRNIIGKVTSGTMSPSLKKGIGMGYIKTAFCEPGNDVYINVRNKSLKAKIVNMPFYKDGKKK